MSFDNTWANATVEDQDRAEAPEPGTYTVVIRDAKAITSKEKGEDWVIVEIEGLDGVAEGHQWPVIQGFRTPQAAGFTKRVCRDLGVDIDNVNNLDDLDAQLKTTIGQYHTVDVKQKGDFKNTYFQGRVTQESLPAAATGGGPGSATNEDGDPIPFLWDGPREYSDRYHANR
jgi:hypothetical protein